MCGMVGYIGERSAVGIILDRLKRLESRFELGRCAQGERMPAGLCST
jgi:hypothetical protein